LNYYIINGFTGKKLAEKGGRCTASPAVGSAKYTTGLAKHIAFSSELPAQVVADLEHAASHSMAKRTWLSYRTAERTLAKYLKEVKQPLELPTSENTMLGFIHWLAYKKGLKAGTISGYISGIRNLHIMKGMEEPKLRSNLLKMVLEGRKNIDALNRLSGSKQERQPVTLDIMHLLKAKLSCWKAAAADKLTAWAICTLLFHGACRGGELICRSENAFDPAVELMRKDLSFKDGDKGKQIQLKLKMPKEARDKRAVIVDIFESGSVICPARAVEKWLKATAGASLEEPAFVWSSGKPVTARSLNKVIRDMLDDDLPQHGISVHSFRTGAASMMAELGYADEDIKAIGRWSSRAFENYIKLARTKRIQTLSNMNDNKSWFV